MANFYPVFLAYLQYSFGIYVFKRPVLTGCGPLLSSLIVIFALFLLLWDIRLYPRSLRKLWSCGDYIAQYLIAVFAMEYIMGSFWFPLEIEVLAFIPKMGIYLEETLAQNSWGCDPVCDVFKQEVTGIFTSYLLSTMCLVAVMHATRMIDLRLLEDGVSCFTNDIKKRIQRFVKKLKRKITASVSRRSSSTGAGRRGKANGSKCPKSDDTDAGCYDPCVDADFPLEERYYFNPNMRM